MKNKKGIGLGEAFGAVLTLILIAVLVIIGIYLFVALQSNAPTSTNSVINESVTTTSGNAQVLSNTSGCGYHSDLSVSAVYNSTGTLLSSGNYTVVAVNGTIKNLTSQGVASPWKVSYTASDGGQFCTANNNMIVAFGTYPALIGLVGTIIFLGIVIGVLVGSFVFRSKSRA